jgi:putative transposase
LIGDTLGLIVALAVTPADVTDREAARPLIQAVVDEHARLERLWADQNYSGELVTWANGFENFELAIVKRPDGVKGWVRLPKRWIVERNFAWFGRYRRLSKDYEGTCERSEDWLYAAMINRMLHLLHPD